MFEQLSITGLSFIPNNDNLALIGQVQCFVSMNDKTYIYLTNYDAKNHEFTIWGLLLRPADEGHSYYGGIVYRVSSGNPIKFAPQAVMLRTDRWTLVDPEIILLGWSEGFGDSFEDRVLQREDTERACL